MKVAWGMLGAGVALLATAAAAPALERVIESRVRGTVHEALFAASFDGQRGLAVGAGGAVLDSEDGGEHWTAQAAPTGGLGLLGVALKSGRAIAVGQTGLVLTRENQQAWQKAGSGTEQRLFAVSLNARGEAAAVGSFGTVLHSPDAGRSWQSIAPDWTPYAADGAQPHLYAVQINEAGDITVAGEFGLILRRPAQSGSWQLLHKGEASIFALESTAEGQAYAVGQSGSVLRSQDNGRNWQTLNVGSDAILLSVHIGRNGQVLITGMRDAVFSRDGGQSWQRLADPLVSTSWYAGVAESASGRLIAVGNAGQLVQINN